MFHQVLTSPASSCARTCPARKHNPIMAKVIVSISRMAIIGKITYRWDDIKYNMNASVRILCPLTGSSLQHCRPFNRASLVAVHRTEILWLSWNKRSMTMTHVEVKWECWGMRISSPKKILDKCYQFSPAVCDIIGYLIVIASAFAFWRWSLTTSLLKNEIARRNHVNVMGSYLKRVPTLPIYQRGKRGCNFQRHYSRSNNFQGNDTNQIQEEKEDIRGRTRSGREKGGEVQKGKEEDEEEEEVRSRTWIMTRQFCTVNIKHSRNLRLDDFIH